MLIADRRWYEATCRRNRGPGTAWIRSGAHPSPSQSQTYQLHPLLSAHLLGVGDVLLESRLLGVVVAKPVPVVRQAVLNSLLPCQSGVGQYQAVGSVTLFASLKL